MKNPSQPRVRADVLLVERGLVSSRARAQALIMAGRVRLAERPVAKAGDLLPKDAPLRVEESETSYVSRGGDKLEGAVEAFAPHGFDAAQCIAVDIGASTGGFTDCLLSHGARKVYAVDVGYGQLAHKLRIDPRVVVRERTNARYLQATDFEEPLDLVVVDASFIGLATLAPAIARILPPGGALVALVKPQFEAGKSAVQRGHGVIRDPSIRSQAIADARSAIETVGFRVIAEAESSLAGPKGNLEHFLFARRIPVTDGPSQDSGSGSLCAEEDKRSPLPS